MEKCQIVPLGVGIGVVWAFYVFSVGITAMFGWGDHLVASLGTLYLGYQASVVGALIGAAWAFADGFIAGVIIAWVYNRLAKPAAG
jgi:hypothetical protein